MPIPLLVAGLVALAGGITLKKGIDAKGKYKEAKDINERAQRCVQRAQHSMDEARIKSWWSYRCPRRVQSETVRQYSERLFRYNGTN